MNGTLILAILRVKSSYARGIELPLDDDSDVPDTLQWWVGRESVWRLKTFALDHDIHVYSVGAPKPRMLDLIQQNNRKHYGDIIKAEHVLAFRDCLDQAEVTAVLQSAGLGLQLEVGGGTRPRQVSGGSAGTPPDPSQFAFWKPDDGEYRTQSTPK